MSFASSNLELPKDKVKFYMKLIVEASFQLNKNSGSLRRDIWDYLNKKYEKHIEYRDFLIAMKQF
jgi:hypothetical protein